MKWQCPDCKGILLKVSILTEGHLTQESDGNFQTEVEGDHEWDEDSAMTCEECGCMSKAGEFEVRLPVTLNYDPETTRIVDHDDLLFLLSLASKEMENTREDDVRGAAYKAAEARLTRLLAEVMAPSPHDSIVAIVNGT